MKTIVIKYGGAAMEDLTLCALVAEEIEKLAKENRVVVVHGGGKEVTAFLDRLGVESKFIDGLRYTDQETLQIAEMFYSGTINKRIVSLLQKGGARAVGISGRDAKMAKINRLSKLGFVGEIISITPDLIETLLNSNFIPVISPISEEDSGQAVNVNGDEMARAVAETLKADLLVYLSDVDGLIIKGKVLSTIRTSEIESLISGPEVTGGMIPKLKSAQSAIKNGVGRVVFLNGKKSDSLEKIMQANSTLGTTITL